MTAFSADLLAVRAAWLSGFLVGIFLAGLAGCVIVWVVRRLGDDIAEPPPIHRMGQFLPRDQLSGRPLSAAEREIEREVFG